MNSKVGQKIEKGDVIAIIHANNEKIANDVESELLQTVIIGEEPKKEINTIFEIIV